MATETELERLVVRLTADTTRYMQQMSAAGKLTADTGKVAADAGKQFDSLQKSIDGVTNLASRAAAGFAAIGIGTGLYKAAQQFENTQLGAARLSSAIQMNGGDVKALTAEYSKFAKQMGEVTTSGKGATLGLLTQAETLGVSGKAAERATQNAISLAAATGGSAQQFLKSTVQLEKGYVPRMLSMALGMRMGRQASDALNDSLDEGEKDATKAAEAQKRLAGMFKLAEIEGSSTEAQLARVARAAEGLSKEVGSLVEGPLKSTIEGLKEAVAWFNTVDPVVRKAVVWAAALTGGLLALKAAGGLLNTTLSTGKSVLTSYVTRVGLAAVGAFELGRALAPTIEGLDKFNAAMLKSTELSERGLSQMHADTERLLANYNDLAPSAKEAFASEQIRVARLDAERYTKQISDLEASVREWESSFAGWVSWIGRSKDALIEQDRAGIEPLKKSLEEVSSRASRFQEELNKVRGAHLADEARKATAAAKELHDEIEKQAATFGMSSEEVKLYELRLRGASAAQLEAAKMSLDALNFMKAQRKEWEANAEAQKRLMDEGKRIAEQFRTPQEILNDRIAELNKLVKAGAIGTTDYERAILDAGRAFDSATDKANEFKAAIGDVQHVAAGSAEAASRFAAFQASLLVSRPTGAGAKQAAEALANAPRGPGGWNLGGIFQGAADIAKRVGDFQVPLEMADFGPEAGGLQPLVQAPLRQLFNDAFAPPGEKDNQTLQVLKNIFNELVKAGKKPAVELAPAELED